MRPTFTAAFTRGLAWADPRVRAAGKSVRAGLIAVLTNPDPPPAWRGKWRRRFAYAVIGVVTFVLVLAALAGLRRRPGPPGGIDGTPTAPAGVPLIPHPLPHPPFAPLAPPLPVP